MSALASPQQVRAIQSARGAAGLRDDVAYRAALGGFGVASTKDLSADQAAAFLDRLNGSRRPVEGRPASARATGPFAAKLQALWIAGWNLGVVRDKDDVAMMHFVEGQTNGIPHTRFLRDPLDAAKAIEAVKAMLARDGGVVWPRKKGPGSIELKRAIVAAQIRRLAELGIKIEPAPEPIDRGRKPPDGAHHAGQWLDVYSRSLGAQLRKVLATRS